MKKQLHGFILILIGILTFVASVSSFVNGGLEVYETLVALDFNFSAIQIDEVATSVIDLIFGALELSFGIKLFQSVKNDEHFNTYKQIPSLINTIISQFLVLLVYQVVMSFLNIGLLPESISTEFVVLNVVLYLVITSSSFYVIDAIKKRKIINLNLVSLFAGLCAVVFYFINYSLIFVSDATILDTIANYINLAVLILIVIFAIASLVYYSSHPELLYTDSIEGEDSEIIASKKNYDVVKIYLNRTTNPAMNNFIKIILVIIGALSIAFGVLYMFNNYYDFITTFDLNEFVNNFELFDMFLLINFLGAIIAFFCGIDLIKIAFKPDGSRKYNNLQGIYSLPMLLSTYTLMSFVFFIFDSSIFNFSSFNFDALVEKVGIGGALILLAFLILSLYSKKIKPIYSRVNDSIKNGEPYVAFSKESFTLCLFNIIPGLIACAGFLFASNFQDISYYLLITAILLTLLVTNLELKFPTEEYVITRRRKLPNEE